MRDREWVVVGGGVHGTYVARELLEAGVERDALAIVDPHGRLLASFRRKARACGMETLRSNYVQHVGPSPFGLETFAKACGREDELVPTRNSQRRPTVELFLDYADHVIERFGLDGLVREATVTDVRREGDLAVETTDGTLRTRRLVLAVGPGEPARPGWTREHDRVEHVWDRAVEPAERVDADEDVVVVGGGTTAATTATALAETAGTVTLWSRQPLREALREADPRWLNWNHIEREVHVHPPGSSARYERIRAARNDGTVPPYLRRELEETPGIERQQGEIRGVRAAGGGLVVAGAGTIRRAVDRVLLATGFEPVQNGSFVARLAESLSLARGFRGLPVLCDETLAWRTCAGERSNVFVTGALAEGTVGPYAGNVPGARRAAERLVAVATARTPTQPA